MNGLLENNEGIMRTDIYFLCHYN